MKRDQLIEGLATHIVENMDTVDLVQFVYEELLHHFSESHIEDLLSTAECNGYQVGEVTA